MKLDIDLKNVKELPDNLIGYICNNYKWLSVLDKLGLNPEELKYGCILIKNGLILILVFKNFKDDKGINREILVCKSFYFIGSEESPYDIRNNINFKKCIMDMIHQIEISSEKIDTEQRINDLISDYNNTSNIYDAMFITIALDSALNKKFKLIEEYDLLNYTVKNVMDIRAFSIEEADMLWEEMDDFIENVKKNIK